MSSVILGFDDWYEKSWLAADVAFRKYGWRATFFVAKPQNLYAADWAVLAELQERGHEIGCHGMSHLPVTEIDGYLEKDVLPAKRMLERHGLKISSFAYPHGMRNIQTDRELLNHFKILRGTTDVAPGVISASHIGTLQVNVASVTKALRAGIRSFYAHEIVFDGKRRGRWNPNGDAIEKICKFAAEEREGFALFKEL